MFRWLMRWKREVLTTSLLAALAVAAFAQVPAPPAPTSAPASALAPAPAPSPAPTPPPAAAPAPPRSPVQGIRNKLSAADLLSAEAIAEVWREQHGEDGPWLVGYSWLARGALLLGEREKAALYADSTRARCVARLVSGADLETDGELETALGAAIEVKAQLVAERQGARAAAAYLSGELESVRGPVALRSRLNKRLDLLTLVGRRAPELVVEETVRGTVPTLASLAGRPVLLYVFAYNCGDCRGSAATLERVAARHSKDGLAVVALTRYYDAPQEHANEKAAIDSAWTATYAGLADTPVALSTASMETYGGSSTPTFVFIDRAGIVRRYTPTRLTEAEFEKTLAPLVR